MKTIVTYVTYLLPGSFFTEDCTEEVANRDVTNAQKKAPEGAFAFYFSERSRIVEGGETLWGEYKRQSGTYFLGGKLMDAVDVQRNVSDPRTLLANMKGNGWKRVIKCRTGNFQPFDDRKDVLLQP